ncbi:hypothetical protein JHK87_046086 [Glycine soja]|nr:hypothetical protein JHK87_046086 [Glycine soja]
MAPEGQQHRLCAWCSVKSASKPDTTAHVTVKVVAATLCLACDRESNLPTPRLKHFLFVEMEKRFGRGRRRREWRRFWWVKVVAFVAGNNGGRQRGMKTRLNSGMEDV